MRHPTVTACTPPLTTPSPSPRERTAACGRCRRAPAELRICRAGTARPNPPPARGGNWRGRGPDCVIGGARQGDLGRESRPPTLPLPSNTHVHALERINNPLPPQRTPRLFQSAVGFQNSTSVSKYTAARLRFSACSCRVGTRPGPQGGARDLQDPVAASAGPGHGTANPHACPLSNQPLAKPRALRRMLSGEVVTKASSPFSSTVDADSCSSVTPQAKGCPGSVTSSS